MAKRDSSTLCPDGCGHLWSEHWCPYKNINTPREIYKCSHCSCGVRGDDVPVPAGFKRVNGAWDYA